MVAVTIRVYDKILSGALTAFPAGIAMTMRRDVPLRTGVCCVYVVRETPSVLVLYSWSGRPGSLISSAEHSLSKGALFWRVLIRLAHYRKHHDADGKNGVC